MDNCKDFLERPPPGVKIEFSYIDIGGSHWYHTLPMLLTSHKPPYPGKAIDITI